MATVKVSRKLQIAVPAEARRALAIAPGDRLEVTVEDGSLRLKPLPRDPLAALRERHGDLWRDGSQWLEEERQAWSEAEAEPNRKPDRQTSSRRSRATQ